MGPTPFIYWASGHYLYTSLSTLYLLILIRTPPAYIWTAEAFNSTLRRTKRHYAAIGPSTTVMGHRHIRFTPTATQIVLYAVVGGFTFQTTKLILRFGLGLGFTVCRLQQPSHITHTCLCRLCLSASWFLVPGSWFLVPGSLWNYYANYMSVTADAVRHCKRF